MDFFSNRRFLWHNQTSARVAITNLENIVRTLQLPWENFGFVEGFNSEDKHLKCLTCSCKLKMKLSPLQIKQLCPKLTLVCLISEAPKLYRFPDLIWVSSSKSDISIHEMHSVLAKHGWEFLYCISDLWFFLSITMGSPEHWLNAEQHKETSLRPTSHATCEFHSNAAGAEVSVTIPTQAILVLCGIRTWERALNTAL